MHIGVIGTGYVGLVTGACLAEFGLDVTCVDIDGEKIEVLKKGIIPIFEPGLEDLVKKNLKEGRLHFSKDVASAIKNNLVIFVTVGTPSKSDGSCDMRYVKSVAEMIRENANGYKVIVNKSTVPVGTGRWMRKFVAKDVDVVSNPEFLREGAAVTDFMYPERVIVGAESDQAIAIMKDIYTPLYLKETPFVITNIETAELTKYACNSYLALKITFINEIANLCEYVGANVDDIARAMGLDSRIGSKFLHAGPGYGGSCFPKDTEALLNKSKEVGYDFLLLKTTVEANKRQREIAAKKIINALDGEVKGKVVGILGLSFKPNTDDIRESPALYIAKKLMKEGAKVKAFDPVAMDNARLILPQISYEKNAYGVAEKADAVVLAVEWNQFRRLDLVRISRVMEKKIFVDLKNVYDKKQLQSLGFNYVGWGK
ncbi:MAG: UDP-glucose/GDP-mannose dehydrogenase family protein [Deltaproteobacteria bacterium]|nr:UDP-glucose/GDP-mannose dehydrogenase family protein [Deltaproteobacteria bacterium]